MNLIKTSPFTGKLFNSSYSGSRWVLYNPNCIWKILRLEQHLDYHRVSSQFIQKLNYNQSFILL